MFDTMTMTKTGGAFFGALLFFMLGSWAADTLYYTGIYGYGDEAHKPGFIIAVPDDDDAVVEEVVKVPLSELLAAADITRGERVYNKCKACHKLEAGVNSTGPYLTGILDRPKGTAEGFDYSNAMAEFGGIWDAEALYQFLKNPRAFMPGNTMSFAGLSKESDRANLIAYLATIGG